MTLTRSIFVVGSARSGTTLMRHILSAHPDVAICGETHFLSPYLRTGYFTRQSFRERFAEVGDIATDEGAVTVVDYIYDEIQGKNWWRWIQQNIPREQFLRGLLQSDRTDRGLFELVMNLSAGGKPIQGEKTPAHIYSVTTLLEWFPGAKVVHMLRDPRAVFVSRRRNIASGRWHLYPFSSVRSREPMLSLNLGLRAIANWRAITRLHRRYQESYPHNYRLVRFEDLVRDPEACVAELCAFLKLPFAEEMVEQSASNTSFGPSDTSVQGFDDAAIDRWRAYLHPVLNRCFVALCGKELQEFGYQP